MAEKPSDNSASARIVYRESFPLGFSVETNALDSTSVLLVHHRTGEGKSYANMGDWSIGIPEMIATGKGYRLTADSSKSEWAPVPGEANALQHYLDESRPLVGRSEDLWCGPEETLDRSSHLRYRARVAVEKDAIDMEVVLTNMSDEPTSFLTLVCNRFTGRGYMWGWRERTYIQLADEWVTVPDIGRSMNGKWFLKSNLPEPWLMECERKGSSADPSATMLTSPYICMESEDRRYTMIYGSAEGALVFINPENPCIHSHPYTARVDPGKSATQTTVMRVYQLPLREAIRRFEEDT